MNCKWQKIERVEKKKSGTDTLRGAANQCMAMSSKWCLVLLCLHWRREDNGNLQMWSRVRLSLESACLFARFPANMSPLHFLDTAYVSVSDDNSPQHNVILLPDASLPFCTHFVLLFTQCHTGQQHLSFDSAFQFAHLQRYDRCQWSWTVNVWIVLHWKRNLSIRRLQKANLSAVICNYRRTDRHIAVHCKVEKWELQLRKE